MWNALVVITSNKKFHDNLGESVESYATILIVWSVACPLGTAFLCSGWELSFASVKSIREKMLHIQIKGKS